MDNKLELPRGVMNDNFIKRDDKLYALEKQYYLSEDPCPVVVKKDTGLDLKEVEEIVGRFNKSSKRAGKLRGEVLVYINGNVEIVHHFTKQVLFKKEKGNE